jgi:hypothetical protein
MNKRDWTWWMVVAAVVGVAEVVVGIGNLASYVDDERRSLVSALLAFLVASGTAALVFGGLAIRRRNRSRGSAALAVGMFPGCCAIVFWWFPPAVAVGVLCMIATTFATLDAVDSRTKLTRAA